MNGLPPTQEQHEQTRQAWLAFKERVRDEGKREPRSKGGVVRRENAAQRRKKIRQEARAKIRDGKKRKEFTEELATRYKLAERTVQDMLKGLDDTSRDQLKRRGC
jgi:hypothetical protein